MRLWGRVSMEETQKKKSLVQDITPEEEIEEQQSTMKTNSKIIIGVYALLIVLGLGTGYVLATRGGSAGASGSIKTDTVVGSTDTRTFKDSAEGTIEAGGVNGEGSHKLLRD